MVGDANGDGIANALDLSIVQQNMNTSGGRAQGDFDGNGIVNSNDLTLLNNNFERRLPSAYFGKVADTATTVPGAGGTFVRLNAPVVDRAGNLGFLGIGQGNYGIYGWSGGVLTRVADNNTPVPSGTGNFVNFGQPSIAGGRLAFQAVGTSQEGIYSYAAGSLTKVVNKLTARPEGGVFTSFGDPTLQDSAFAFVGSAGDNMSAYTLNGSVVTPVVNTSTPIPGGTGTFTAIDNPISDGSNYFFVGHGIGQFGIYKKSGSAVTALLDKNTTVPGTAAKFTSIANLSQDGPNVSFTGVFAGTSGVFGLTGSDLQKVADTTTMVPGDQGSHFTNFGVSSIGGPSVAFVGYDEKSRPGIYAWIGGELNRVIDSSVTLGGKIISDLDLSRSAVNGNRVTFQARFTDGSSALFSASLLASRVPGDVNNDGVVNSADFAIVQKNLGLSGGRASGDLNGDGVVDFHDYQILERTFGKTGVAPLLGDADGDRKVDAADLAILLSNLGKYGSIAQGDFNGNGRIDFGDYQAVEAAFGKSAAAYMPFGSGIIPLQGDTNGDGRIDASDLSNLLANLGNYGSPWQGDVNGDGKVDFKDFQLFELAYSGAVGLSADVPLPGAVLAPEPTGVLALFAGAMLLGRRRGRGAAR
jgi:hypothetical protein